jgi:GT2 family glycosyltransferase
MVDNIKLSVIIVAYKSNDVVNKCLESIEKYNDIGDRLEVILVDNYPIENDAFGNLELRYKWLRTICNPENKGFGHGNNKGVRIAKGEYILFLNPDTELVEPIFDYAVRQFTNNSNLTVFGMLLYDKDGKICFNSFSIMPEHKGFLPSFLWVPIFRYCRFTPRNIFPLGADFFIRKSAFLAAGGFDENIFLCYEEPDLMRRIPGSRKVRIFNKRIIHLGGHAMESVTTERYITWFLESEQYYFNKHRLNYPRYARYALSRLRIKNIVKRLTGSKSSHADIMFMEHYHRIASSSI